MVSFVNSVPLPTPSPPILPQPVTRLPLPPTHSPPVDQPTIWTLYNPNHLQSLTQAPYTTTPEIHQAHTRNTKPSSPHTASPIHPPHFLSPLLVPPYLTPQISIANLTNVSPPTFTAYKYYHEGVFYIIHKLLVKYWNCELVIAKIHIQTRERNSTPT
jgi:hypothetical protein